MKNFARSLVGMSLMLMGANTCFGIEPSIADQARVIVEKGAFRAEEWTAASDGYLDSLRGGFDAGGGLMVSFGYERTVTINGNVVSTIRFNLPDVGKITAEIARTVSAALAAAGIVQNGAGNRVEASFAAQSPANVDRTAVAAADVAKSSSTGNATGAGITAQSPANSDRVAAAAAEVTKSSSTGNAASVGVTAQFPTNTVIQNSLNNQTIKSLTVIDAGVTSLGLFKTINFQTTLKDSILGAMGTR